MASKKVSGLSGIVNATDDSLVMLSFTEDGGQTYQTRKIKLIDLIDDFRVEDLANVSGTPVNGQVLIYSTSTGQWQPGNQTGGSGGGGGIGEAPADGNYYTRHNNTWVPQDLLPLLAYRLDVDGGDFDIGYSAGAVLTVDGGDFDTGVALGVDASIDGGVFA